MTEKEARERIFLAVDFTDLSHAPHLMQIASGLGGLKIDTHQDLPLKSLVSMAKSRGVNNVYIDAKSSDGPDQMPLTIVRAERQQADYLSIQISAGAAAVQAAVSANHNGLNLVGATIPSDMPDNDCIENYGEEPKKVVSRLASIAAREGLKFVTCSSREIPTLREYGLTRKLSVFATGIRMPYEEKNDQIRVSTPAEAMASSADYIVVGRSITASDDPERATALIVENMMLVQSVEKV